MRGFSQCDLNIANDRVPRTVRRLWPVDGHQILLQRRIGNVESPALLAFRDETLHGTDISVGPSRSKTQRPSLSDDDPVGESPPKRETPANNVKH